MARKRVDAVAATASARWHADKGPRATRALRVLRAMAEAGEIPDPRIVRGLAAYGYGPRDSAKVRKPKRR